MLMRQEAIKTAVSRFVELPTLQRSVVILNDVLDASLIEIAALLGLTVDAVKGHPARGRARLRDVNAQAGPPPDARPASAALARYVALFNQRDWDGLRARLADDVKLNQSAHPIRVGAADRRSVLHPLRQDRWRLAPLQPGFAQHRRIARETSKLACRDRVTANASIAYFDLLPRSPCSRLRPSSVLTFSERPHFVSPS
jgi:Sigma-70, region 4